MSKKSDFCKVLLGPIGGKSYLYLRDLFFLMLKRGQTQQIFVWLVVLVVAVSILFFGIKLIKKTENLKDDALVVKFFNDLDKKLSQYYYLDRGSSGEERFLLPGYARWVCFVNETGNFVEGNVPDNDGGLVDKLKDFSDVFVGPLNLYEENRFNMSTKITLDNNPECFDVANGALTINLKNEIKNKIYTIRGVQVMFDRDLAKLYAIETRVLKQAVNRNKNRFPPDFMFILTEKEVDVMVSQNVIPSKKHLGGALPYAFTEQGVANLSSVLNSDKAIEVNIQIMRAFVAMRKFISLNSQLFQRMDVIEKKQIESDKKIDPIFDIIQSKEIKPEKGIFFDGQIFDAYKFFSDIVRNADNSIVLIDNFIDDSVLTLFKKRKENVKVTIFTKEISKQLLLDLKKYNSQYPLIEVKEFKQSHDRFIIKDNREVYHFGASLKDLGKKWFGFSKFDKETFTLLDKLEKRGNT